MQLETWLKQGSANPISGGGSNSSQDFSKRGNLGPNDRMTLRVGWTDPKTNTSGDTTTGIFTVAKDSSSVTPGWADNLSTQQTNGAEESWDGASPVPQVASASDGNSTTSSSASPSSSPHKSGSGGLSTGAIAGIAVGAAVGVILLSTILAIVFIKRRNSSRRRGSVDSAGVDRRREILRDKETYMHDTRSTDSPSPRSPSIEERGPPQLPPPTLVSSPNPSTVGMAVTMGESPRQFQGPTFPQQQPKPLPAHPVERPLPQQPAPPQTPLPMTPPQKQQQQMQSHSEHSRNVSSSVAHLVEEGMTAEDIRRLEEEERALDDAIAQRGT